MAADDSRFKVLSTDDRRRTVDQRRRALESELWTHEVNRIGSADPASQDARIAELEAALEELDQIAPPSTPVE